MSARADATASTIPTSPPLSPGRSAQASRARHPDLRNRHWHVHPANKFPGVRAAPCHDDLSAEMSRRHNDLNLLCLSADMLGEKLIDRMVEIWLQDRVRRGPPRPAWKKSRSSNPSKQRRIKPTAAV